MSLLVRTVAYIALTVAASAPAGLADEPTGDAVAQRFFAHLDANQPVAGEFDITTTIDEAALKATAPPGSGPAGGASAKPEPAKQALHCRWAWATGREVCQQLSGSQHAMYGFLSLPEGTLIGYNDKQYNLVKADTLRADVTRPALFYFISGANPWKKQFDGATFSLRTPTDRPGMNVLTAERNGVKTILTLEENTSRLRGVEILIGNKVGWRLTIDAFATSPTDGRVFPTAATISTYPTAGNGKSDKPLRTTTLRARRVDFPTPTEVASQFRLPVPSHALVGDRILNAAIEPTRPTDAAEIITQDVPRKPFTPPPLPAAPKSSNTWARTRLIAALLVLPFGGYGAYSLVRYLRTRNGRAPKTNGDDRTE